MSTRSITVHKPEEAAQRLGGISIAQLVAILKAKGYDYTELKPGSTPWGRGRQSWGMTDEQIAAFVAGQTRRHPRPDEEQGGTKPDGPAPGLGPLGHDGKSRIRYPRSRKG